MDSLENILSKRSSSFEDYERLRLKLNCAPLDSIFVANSSPVCDAKRGGDGLIVNIGGSDNDDMTGSVKRRVSSKSPVSTADLCKGFNFESDGLKLPSFEAPARLQSALHVVLPRSRAYSSSDFDDYFCRLDTSLPNILSADLPKLVRLVDIGLKAGVSPTLADDAMGGTYFLRDSFRSICVVFKPSDEEPSAPNNPRQSRSFMGKYRSAYIGGILPGFGMFRELAAFALDDGFAGVPPTHLAKVRHSSFFTGVKDKDSLLSHSYKIGSVQSYVRSVGSAVDIGPSLFDIEDIHRIAIMDIRLCNMDRHAGNLLVSHESPYQTWNSNWGADRFCGGQNTSALCVPEGNEVLLSSSAPASLGSFSLHDFAVSSRTSCIHGCVDKKPQYRLIPIDHGFVLPHILHIREVIFAWMEWSGASLPLSVEMKKYIQDLDVAADIQRLRKVVGAAIPKECYLTLRVCTRLLQQGVLAGMNLVEIGALITGDVNSNSTPLLEAVSQAINRVRVHVFTCCKCGLPVNNCRVKKLKTDLSSIFLPTCSCAIKSMDACPSSVVDDTLSLLLQTGHEELICVELDHAVDELVNCSTGGRLEDTVGGII